MKKRLLTVFVLFYSIIGLAQVPGTIDPNFNATMAAVPVFGVSREIGIFSEVFAVSVLSDDKILVGGNFSRYNSILTNTAGILRLNPDGSKDTTFNTPYDYLRTVYAIGVQNDGKIIVGGGFLNYSSTIARSRIARLNADGSLDNSFTIGMGFNDIVKTIVVQADGKVIVGGDFTSYNGVAANRIIRLNADGSIDTSFTVGTGFDQTVEKIHLQSDGKLLLCGPFTMYDGVSAVKLVRLEANGARDTTFSIGTGFLYSTPTAIVNSVVCNLAIQPDNKIVVVGTFSTFNNTAVNNIARLNADGSLDPGFNSGTGFTAVPLQIPKVNEIIIQDNGKIVVCGGYFNSYNDFATEKNMIRINPDGTIDPSFDLTYSYRGNADKKIPALQSDGKIIIGGDFVSFDSYPHKHIARINPDGFVDPTFGASAGFDGSVEDTFEQPDGKLLVCGSFGSYNKTTAKTVARLNANGSLDTTFSSGIGFNDWVFKVITQTDGKILVCGAFTKYNTTNSNRIIRLNPDGLVDASFNVGTGFATASFLNDIAVQTDGKIIVAGALLSYNGTTLNHIVRLNSDGSIDPTFNVGTGFNKTTYAIKIQPDGKILIGGLFTTYNGSPSKGIIRLNNDGTKDVSFNTGTGFANSSVTSTREFVHQMLVQPDGKVLCIGFFNSYNGSNADMIVRLNANGSYDSTFSTGTFDTSLHISGIKGIASQLDGKIIVVGDLYNYSGVSCYGTVRMNADGSYDNTFSASTGAKIEDNLATSVRVLSDGKIIMAGDFKTFSGKAVNRILKLNTDGTRDLSFNTAGFDNTVNTIALQADHKILAGGTFTAYNGATTKRIARIHTDGNLDNSFSSGSGFDAGVNKIKVQADNKILVGGDFISYNGTTANRIIRLLGDGTADTSFNTGTGFDNRVLAIALQNNGKIIIAGDFTSYNGVAANRIIRLNPDGSIDSVFAAGLGFNNTIYAIALQSDGKMLIGGSFTNYNGTAVNRIVRLNDDGSRDTSFTIGSGFNNIVRVIVLQPDGKIMVGGNFTSYNGATANRIVRLNISGGKDILFSSGSGFDNFVNTIEIESGKIIAGGNFTTYNGTTAAKLARISASGSIDATFSTTTGFDNTVLALAVQEDGKILAGGLFNQYKTTVSNYFLRLIGDTPPLATPSFTQDEKEMFVLYPNPAGETLNVAMTDNNNATFRIYNLIGNLVKSGKTSQNGINISDLQPGIYIFELKDGQKTAAKKFIKK
ncbi:T9SS type A sorting domain-containing protein [Flavobacterium humi]|uniref:T9SS type A sorting domain-containing protein n=1 Tax=Flavobacterium humi TaxID=2562683 RepID=A0A4Z0L8S2_9FLAO|nr:T9SS type A sorting domain-containing protein [Flavobacterium humi]TGD58700.1 T9SS type A sorting domain-containing protein [Flavobacterium humi]